MKKYGIALLLSLALLLTGCGGSEKPKEENPPSPPAQEQEGAPTPQPEQIPEKGEMEIPADPVLVELQTNFSDYGALIGVAYLGYDVLPAWEDVTAYLEANGFVELYPFLGEIDREQAVLLEGGELYLVIPADEDVTLTVSEYLMQDVPEKGEDMLTLGGGKPLLLRGNISEIVPNLLITARTAGGEEMEYLPCLSGMDGSLVVEDRVYDFTPYDLVMGPYLDGEWVPEAIFTGTWYARAYDGDYEEWAMTLVLHPDGRAEYSYGVPYGELSESFTGIWTEWQEGEDSKLELTMTGGPVSADGNLVEGESYEITSTFVWDYQGSALLLRHEGGSPLLFGAEEAWYTFLAFDGFHLVNNWTEVADYRDWYYDLQLFETGECGFSIGEVGGEMMVGYEGWWYLEGEELTLTLLHTYGEHPENPETGDIYGSYILEHWEPGTITLTYFSGDILTLNMEEYGKATFFGY